MRGDSPSALGLALAPADTFWALGSLCNLHRLPFDAGLLARAYPPPHTVATLLDALRGIGCAATLASGRAARLETMALPALVLLVSTVGEDGTRDGQNHAARPALLVRVDDERVVYFAAGANTPTACDRKAFVPLYLGIALRVARVDGAAVADVAPPPRRFGFRWFLPELARHKAVWREVVAASLGLQLLALVLPLLSQVVVDKVIVHRATSTLTVIGAALALIVAFTTLLGWIRQHLVLHTGNRIDAVLGVEVFRHLLALPLRYFETRATGVLTARLSGIETIREFLCGAFVALVLDVPFLAVFVAVMLFYSVPLTLLTLAAVALLAAVSAIAAPILQRRFDAQFLAGARVQAFVTEHLAGVETVKALELEPQLAGRHRALLADHLAAGFATRQTANTYQSLVHAIEQSLSAGVLCVGAWLVMTNADFTIGMLVAFQMFSSRVAQPLLRLAGLWQQFQQAAIAVRRLGDVMDAQPEPRVLVPARTVRGPGSIAFCGVGFRYAPEHAWLLRGFDAVIEPGTCVAVTGPSGCGKSTLLKLLLAFALPTEGAVRIDGRDTRAHAANELRARFGVVPQEITLFSGTVLANVQLGDALAGLPDVVKACRIAGIHDAIEALPDGYATVVGERGVGLSGGQRQRLALARALLRRPQILLLDEPFSQLDADAASRIAEAIGRLRGAVTIVVVTHVLPPGLVFDRRIDLGGRGAATGSEDGPLARAVAAT
ncbi:MAG TPA: peptidase domain-containing ABC transporter [Casimicrobiaceae bacterium]|nr:peptidase domain-containing ABC transporter [Casimicrobiaceae bacterium]